MSSNFRKNLNEIRDIFMSGMVKIRENVQYKSEIKSEIVMKKRMHLICQNKAQICFPTDFEAQNAILTIYYIFQRGFSANRNKLSFVSHQ